MHDALERVLLGLPAPAIAVSGGVDSVTLAAVAAEMIGDVLVVHAVSPAVPAEATARVRRLAALRGWQLQVIEAGEFEDPSYRANPVNRCFFCKTNLYGAIRLRTTRQILSGANTDDLGEYRPGLDAARLHGVRHPFVEAGVGKDAVRRIARALSLHEVAELPSSPCLASRVETGIRIESHTLAFVHRVERAIAAHIAPTTVRCRIRASAVVVELDSRALSKLDRETCAFLETLIDAQPHRPGGLPVHFQEYRNGSAFLVETH